jgi:carboxypeptidase Q
VNGGPDASIPATPDLVNELMKYVSGMVSLAFFLTAAGVQASESTPSEVIAASLRDAALRDSVAWEIVSEVTTRFGPRPAGSAADRAAAEWSAAKMKSLGFANVQLEEFPLTAWVRGMERVEITAPFAQPLAAVALGGAPPTDARGVEGEVAMFGSFAELAAAPRGSLAGKIAFISYRMTRTQDGSGYGAAGAGRRNGPGEAAERGAVGFMLRSLATGGARMPHTGATAFVKGRVPLPSFALAEPDAEQIERLIQLGEKVRVRLTSSASYVKDARSQNVIGEIRGSDRAGEVIVLGAHLDSWDLGTGAIDDAAGMAIITAAAKLIAGAPRPPRRTVRVVFFGAEEVSQPELPTPRGGLTYRTNREAQLGSHVLAGESDFGADRVYAVSLPKGAAGSPFGKALLSALSPLGILPSTVPPGDGGADIAPLNQAGVPVFVLRQDGSKYFDYHHTADDTLDKIDRSALSQNVAAWAVLTWLAADGEVSFR